MALLAGLPNRNSDSAPNCTNYRERRRPGRAHRLWRAPNGWHSNCVRRSLCVPAPGILTPSDSDLHPPHLSRPVAEETGSPPRTRRPPGSGPTSFHRARGENGIHNVPPPRRALDRGHRRVRCRAAVPPDGGARLRSQRDRQGGPLPGAVGPRGEPGDGQGARCQGGRYVEEHDLRLRAYRLRPR